MPENDEITEEEIRNRLQHAWETLRAGLIQLAFLQRALPPSPQETSEEDIEGPLDFVTEVRASVASAIRDDLGAALRKIRAAVKYQPEPD